MGRDDAMFFKINFAKSDGINDDLKIRLYFEKCNEDGTRKYGCINWFRKKDTTRWIDYNSATDFFKFISGQGPVNRKTYAFTESKLNLSIGQKEKDGKIVKKDGVNTPVIVTQMNNKECARQGIVEFSQLLSMNGLPVTDHTDVKKDLGIKPPSKRSPIKMSFLCPVVKEMTYELNDKLRKVKIVSYTFEENGVDIIQADNIQQIIGCGQRMYQDFYLSMRKDIGFVKGFFNLFGGCMKKVDDHAEIRVHYRANGDVKYLSLPQWWSSMSQAASAKRELVGGRMFITFKNSRWCKKHAEVVGGTGNEAARMMLEFQKVHEDESIKKFFKKSTCKRWMLFDSKLKSFVDHLIFKGYWDKVLLDSIRTKADGTGPSIWDYLREYRGVKLGERRRLTFDDEAWEHHHRAIMRQMSNEEATLPDQSNATPPHHPRRRLVEAAYCCLIGFNVLLMCCLAVGVCFVCRQSHSKRHRPQQPIRW